jgi:hypothetical protein
MKKTNHVYDIELISELCKAQPEGEFNSTDVARKYCKKLGIEYKVSRARTVQVIVKKHQFHIDLINPKMSTQFVAAEKRKYKGKSKNVMVAWAQAKTPIDDNLWDNMLVYAEEHDAEILVIPGTYLNPNSPYSTQVRREFAWDEKISDYMYATESNIHKHLIMIADTDVLPTGKRPLNNFHSITGLESCIIGHPRQHMQVVPTMKNSRRKFMFTTGSITVPNYRKARAGKESKVHHKMGFLFIENLDSENFTARHVHAEKDGSFEDLHYRIFDGTVVKVKKPWEAMIFGDTHLSKEDQGLLDESRRLIDEVGCKQTVWHDLMDGYSINHHQMKDHVEQVIKANKGLNVLEDELEMNISFINEWKDTNMVIVPSNHPDWLDKWVRFNHNAKHAINSVLFNKFQSVLYEEKAPKGLYAYVINKEFGREVNCLHRDDSHMVCGIELNNHGDLGSNGAKGTPLTFAKLNTQIVSGDKHHSYTLDNAYGVGLSAVLDHNYNKGMSSWTQSNGIILSNGRFQHLLYFNGKFTNLI